MNENDVAAAMLPVAIRTAKKLWADPEAESIAGEACIKAIRSFDGRGTLEGHVKRCTRVHIFHTWRAVKRSAWLQYQAFDVLPASCTDEPICETPLTELEWQILCEKYELCWPFDVVAKRHNMSTRYVKKLIPWLVYKLEQAYASTEDCK